MLDYNSFKEKMQHSSTASKLGIDNSIPADLLWNLKTLFAHYTSLEQVSEKPIYITSGYRCARLNKAVGGVSNSNHKKCRAFDFAFRGVGSKTVFLQVFDNLKNTFLTYYKKTFDDDYCAALRRFNHHFIAYPDRLFVHYQIKDGFLYDYIIPLVK